MFGLLIAAFGTVLVVLFIWYVIMYLDQYNYGYTIPLSFKDFYKYYQLCPDCWTTKYDILARTKRGQFTPIVCRIKFTSYWQYYLFVRSKEHGHKMNKQKEAYIDLLEEVQKDIDDCRVKAKRYRDEGIDILKNL